MARTNVVQHKILNNPYLHRFFCSNNKSYHNKYRHAFSLGEKTRERLSETFIDMFMLVQNFSLVNTKY